MVGGAAFVYILLLSSWLFGHAESKVMLSAQSPASLLINFPCNAIGEACTSPQKLAGLTHVSHSHFMQISAEGLNHPFLLFTLTSNIIHRFKESESTAPWVSCCCC